MQWRKIGNLVANLPGEIESIQREESTWTAREDGSELSIVLL